MERNQAGKIYTYGTKKAWKRICFVYFCVFGLPLLDEKGLYGYEKNSFRGELGIFKLIPSFVHLNQFWKASFASLLFFSFNNEGKKNNNQKNVSTRKKRLLLLLLW